MGGLWTKTVLDLTSVKWRARADSVRASKQDLESQVFNAYRDPSLSERDAKHYANHSERITRCCAFGQHADNVEGIGHERSQHGLFGTGAAFYVLSRSEWAAAPDESSFGPESHEWRQRYARTLNFLDMAISQDGGVSGGPWAQRDMVLRVVLLLRASAAAAAPLGRSQLLHAGESMDPAASGELKKALEDLSVPPHKVCPEHTRRLISFVRECRAPPSEIEGAYAASHSPSERTWRFSVGDASAARVVDEWVFVWSQVLASVVRSAHAGLISAQDAAELCSEENVRLVRRLLLDETPTELDPRFHLLGLWALAHLDHATPRGPLNSGPGSVSVLSESHLCLGHRDRKLLKREVKAAWQRLTASEVALVDGWRAYSLKPSENGWRDDFMVVPVVPVLLQLVSRYRPYTLTESASLRLIRLTCRQPASDEATIGAARAHQTGDRDGTVNLAYYHDALEELTAAMESASRSAALRLGATAFGVWRGWGRAGVFLAILAVMVATYIGFLDEPSDAVLGLLFGLTASWLAAIATPPFITFFWGDR